MSRAEMNVCCYGNKVRCQILGKITPQAALFPHTDKTQPSRYSKKHHLNLDLKASHLNKTTLMWDRTGGVFSLRNGACSLKHTLKFF